MFGRKKQKKALFHDVDDSRITAYDFRLRSTILGFESYRALEYTIYKELEKSVMIPKIDAHLSKLFSGNVDDANGNMVDSIILSVARKAVPDLNRQRYNHDDTLQRLIIRHNADMEDIRRITQDREKEYESIKADYDKVCMMMEKLG